MGRGVSSGGGQSSLGYLFGSDEPAKPATDGTSAAAVTAGIEGSSSSTHSAAPKTSPTIGSSINLEIPAGQLGNNPTNNYHRAEGQNTGNFITDRPSTKVHAAPGGGSSLGYLFGGN